MTLTPGWLLRLAGHDVDGARRLAGSAVASERAGLQAELHADERRFRERMDALVRVPHVVLGETASGVPYRIATRELTSLPWWTTAATGTGKSRFVGAVMAHVIDQIVAGAPLSLVLVDGKGETADMQLRMLAERASRLNGRARQQLLSHVHTMLFFDREVLPSWPLMARVVGVDAAVLADAVAEVLCDVVADASTGPRQRSALAAVVALAIEMDVPAAGLPWLLSSPKEVTALASRSSLPSVRLDLSRFEREPQGSIDGLVARLGTILRSPSLKAIFSGESAFDFSQCFEPGNVTTIGFGGADLGARAAVRAVGSLAISALANAAFDPRRRVRGTTLLVVDEPQAVMTSVTTAQFERLITLGRSFGAGGLVLLHQGATQLPTELQSVLNTNVPLRVLGTSSERDAAASAEWLPRTGRVPRAREQGRGVDRRAFLNEGEEQRFRVAELGRLPRRHFLVSDRRVDFAPRVVRAPDHDPPPWSELPPEVAQSVRFGSCGVPREQLEERVRQIEEDAAARFAERQADESRRRDETRRRDTPATPDVAGARRGRPPGGVP